MTLRIDTFRRQLAGTIGLLELVRSQLDDLHALAYDRPRAAAEAPVRGGTRDYALDTHGDARARDLWKTLALRVTDATEDLTVVLHDTAGYLSAGSSGARRDRTADAPAGEIHAAIAAQARRRARGDYTPAATVAQPDAPDVSRDLDELDQLRSLCRKLAAGGIRPDRSRLTPLEHDAWRHAVDPDSRQRRRGRKKRRGAA
jgi:hypothetical protein